MSFPASVKKIHQTRKRSAGTTGAPARSQRRGSFQGEHQGEAEPEDAEGKDVRVEEADGEDAEEDGARTGGRLEPAQQEAFDMPGDVDVAVLGRGLAPIEQQRAQPLRRQPAHQREVRKQI